MNCFQQACELSNMFVGPSPVEKSKKGTIIDVCRLACTAKNVDRYIAKVISGGGIIKNANCILADAGVMKPAELLGRSPRPVCRDSPQPSPHQPGCPCGNRKPFVRGDEKCLGCGGS
ncbi:MAG: hypothetical protein KF795_00680 [Labilithrix sp.]|nr:hypothetical protein [Labilithrix sp.]